MPRRLSSACANCFDCVHWASHSLRMASSGPFCSRPERIGIDEAFSRRLRRTRALRRERLLRATRIVGAQMKTIGARASRQELREDHSSSRKRSRQSAGDVEPCNPRRSSAEPNVSTLNPSERRRPDRHATIRVVDDSDDSMTSSRRRVQRRPTLAGRLHPGS